MSWIHSLKWSHPCMAGSLKRNFIRISLTTFYKLWENYQDKLIINCCHFTARIYLISFSSLVSSLLRTTRLAVKFLRICGGTIQSSLPTSVISNTRKLFFDYDSFSAPIVTKNDFVDRSKGPVNPSQLTMLFLNIVIQLNHAGKSKHTVRTLFERIDPQKTGTITLN
jgi:hypothetical protein